MTLNKRGFTLVELIVVIAMIAVFMASVGTAVGKTRERARVEKARGDVKVLSQAILAWENYSRNGKNELREMNDVEAVCSDRARARIRATSRCSRWCSFPRTARCSIRGAGRI